MSYTVADGSDADNGAAFNGYNSTNHFAAQDFTTVGAGTVQTFAVKISGVNSPSDYSYLTFESDNAGAPSGTVLGTSDNVTPDVWPTSSKKTYTLASPVSVTASTKYWIVMKRTGADSTAAYYNIGGGAGAGGNWLKGNTTPTWTAQSVPIFADMFVVSASGPANVKTINGLALASVKTVNGLAIASVKTVNGLA